MKKTTNTLAALVAFAAILSVAAFSVRAADAWATDGIDEVLDDFNLAAAKADFDAYFACFAPNAVFIGTDASERMTADQLRSYARPYFDRERGRARRSQERHITLCPGGVVAAFDELLNIETLGLCRATGVLVNLRGEWLIKQYSLSVPVPNEIFLEVVDRIQAYGDRDEAMPDEAEDEVRAALDAYVAVANFPEPRPVDGSMYAADIDAIWGNGAIYRGREAMVNGLVEAQAEIAVEFESCEARVEDVRIRRRDNVAWARCRIVIKGVLTDDRGSIDRIVQSTFVYEFDGSRWRMVQEHSSLVSVDRHLS